MKRKVLFILLALVMLTVCLPAMAEGSAGTTKKTTEAPAVGPASAWPMMQADSDGKYVMGSDFERDQIGSIEFSGSLDGVPADAWDVSADQNGSVMAWVTAGADGLYDLHIAGNGGVRLPENSSCLFSEYRQVREIHFVSCVSTADVTDMNSMFYDCSGLTALDVSGFDTANVTDMFGVFSECSGLTALDVSNFDTANVTYMYSMFENCSGLTALDVSNFDTANVTSMSCMFLGCSGLTALDLSNFDTANVTYMKSMFKNCSGLTALDVSNFDTANVTSMSCMFLGCSGLTALDLSNFDTANVTNMKSMFKNCSGLQSIRVSRKFIVPETNIAKTDMLKNCPAGGLTYID